jgi:hypothetical protein
VDARDPLDLDGTDEEENAVNIPLRPDSICSTIQPDCDENLLSPETERPREPCSTEHGSQGLRQKEKEDEPVVSPATPSKPVYNPGDKMCPICKVSTTEMTVNYSYHFRHEHPGLPFKKSIPRFALKCPECPFETRSQNRGTWKNHLFSHGLVGMDEVYRYKCKQCKEMFICFKTLQTHEHKVHGAPKCAKCHVCGKEFSNFASLRYHQVNVHEGRKKTCERCDKEFGYVAYYDHLRKCRFGGKKEPKTSVLCSMCGAAFLTKRGVDSHMTTVHGEGNFVRPYKFEAACSDCGTVFKTKPFFLAHMFQQHGKELPGLKKYPCPDCDEVFYTKCKLDTHAILHTNEKLTCSDCGYQTRFKGNLSRHTTRVHKKRLRAYKPRESL